MNLWSITFLIVATTFSVVQSWCIHFNPLTVNFDHLCGKWWNKASDYRRYSSSRTTCIYLIKEKCPHMITLDTPIRKRFDGSYETWITDGTAYRVGYGTLNFIVLKKRSLCSDDNGKSIDCKHWWSVAQEGTAPNKYKEICVNRIMKYCKDMITDVQETKTGDVQRFGAGYEVKTVTYTNKDGDKASLNRYVSAMKKPKKN